MSQQTKVDANIVQDFTDAQKSQARNNIGAASESALSTLGNTVGNLSYQVAANTGSITTLENKYTPTTGTGSATYNVAGDHLICELSACKVYCNINTENYCQLKVTVNDDKIGADQSTIKSINGNFNGFRVWTQPWSTGTFDMYTSNIPYDINNNGTIEIDILTTDAKMIHLTVWYRTAVNNDYQFYVVEEVRS